MPSFENPSVTDSPVKQAEPHSRALPGAESGKILIIKDKPGNRDRLSKSLKLLGYQTVTATRSEALALQPSEKFALILTAYPVPEADTAELSNGFRRAQAQPENRMPIIAITADASPDVREKCLRAGMDDCLIKPLPLSQLNHVISRWLGPASTAVIDPFCLSRLIGDDPELHAHFLKKFRLQAFDTLSLIKEAAAKNDSAAVRVASHQLKSSARAAGALQTADLLNALEGLARNADREAINRCIADIDTQLRAINQYCETRLI